MAALKININNCVGCGFCLKSCTNGAIHIENKKAYLHEAKCTLCGVCVQACKFNAIYIEREVPADTGNRTHNGVWIFAEQSEGQLLPVVLELLGKGRALAVKRNCKLTALIGGNSDMSLQERLLFEYGADQVLVCCDEQLDGSSELSYADFICEAASQLKPEILLFGATGFGRSIAPRIAARLQTGLTADCTVLDIDLKTGLLCQTRPAFGGNLMATIACPIHRPQISTVRPGIMSPCEPRPGRIGNTIYFKLKENKQNPIEVMETIRSDNTRTISDAKIIVSAGKGIGSKKNMALVYKLASILGGEVGISRALVDSGWGEYRQQIGQTGFSVAPKLLITCGISGAIQHLAGIGGAQNIISINNDPDARIFSVSHYKVVGDCVEILNSLIAALEQG